MAARKTLLKCINLASWAVVNVEEVTMFSVRYDKFIGRISFHLFWSTYPFILSKILEVCNKCNDFRTVVYFVFMMQT